MTHSRKDKPGGHRRTEIVASRNRSVGVVVWGESGKRYAKRLRSKLARRHNRVSIRDLELIEPVERCDAWEEYELDGFDDRWDDPWTDFCEPDDSHEYDEPYDYWYGYDYDYAYDY